MEHLIVYFIHFIISLDGRWLRPLRTWVPDWQQILYSPLEILRQRDVEVGPWTRYVKIYVVPLMLLVPLLIVVIWVDSVPLTIGLVAVWLVVARLLAWAGRGGWCVIRADSVEFQFRGVAVRCPWDLFHVGGQTYFNPGGQLLHLPVNPAAAKEIMAWKDDSPLGDGWQAHARHFQLMPNGEVRLQWVYGVLPHELGNFLLELGRALGKTGEPAEPLAPAAKPARPQMDTAGWLSVNLTRLQFPPSCCDCGLEADSYQQFRGYRSMFSSDLSAATAEVVINVPVCLACQQRNRSRYLRTLLTVAALSILGVTLFCFLIGVILDFCGWTPGPGIMTVIMTSCGFILSLALSWVIAENVARAASEPIFLKDFRPTDGTVQLRFRNRQYAESFL